MLIRVFLSLFVVFGSFVFIPAASAHNVWCHCSFADPRDTLEFFHKAGAVYKTLSEKVILAWHEANAPLEEGVLAEFESKINKDNKVRPDLLRQTMTGLESVRAGMTELDQKLSDLESFVSSREVTPVFDSAVAKLIKEERPFERLSDTGVRYAEVSGGLASNSNISGILDIIKAQRQDLAVLAAKLDEVLEGLRDAIPLAEKGDFARVMLSGRNSFGDKMPQFTDMISAYERLYVRTCMTTIAATMQVYPKGFEWLR